MSEPGGPTTQGAISYQNSVAARALLALLDLGALPERERVVEVRVEAPEQVDDVVLRYADGHAEWQNVKTNIASSGQAWDRMLRSIDAQFSDPVFGADDQVRLVFRERDNVSLGLRTLVERASTSLNEEEWRGRLTAPLSYLVEAIERVSGLELSVLELLRRLKVQILPQEEIERDFARLRLVGAFTLPATLFGLLRDIAAEGGGRRLTFVAPTLRRQLLQLHGVRLEEPGEWGLPAYRATAAQLARIEIPGTRRGGRASDLFVWPMARPFLQESTADFEDEIPGLYWRPPTPDAVDLRVFPDERLDRAFVIGGPGYGKSALLTAVSARLLDSPYVPVTIPLASFATTDQTVIEFLSSDVNREFEVQVDWLRLAEQGLLVLLLDGLDEIPAAARPRVMKRLATFSARHPRTPWLLTVRDPAALTGAVDAQLLELMPLDSSDIGRFVETIRPDFTEADTLALLERLRAYPDLEQLVRIPLFLVLLLATMNDRSELPRNRSELIEAYLTTLFNPDRLKDLARQGITPPLLREVAERLAFQCLEEQQVGATEAQVRDAIGRSEDRTASIDHIMAALVRLGILRRQSAVRLSFPYPIVQEFLAACHLVRVFPETLAQRIEDAVARPWAQAVQFSLELHYAPQPIIENMIERDDDAFATGLRLVGRCIANGVRVSPELRHEVARRLVAFWISAPTRAREKVGQLLFDAFARPIFPELRGALHHRWLLNDGGGNILSALHDYELTASVLRHLTTDGLEQYMHYHDMKPALNALGDEAFEIIVARARDPELDEEGINGLSDLLQSLSPAHVSESRGAAIAEDEALPLEIRLSAALLTEVTPGAPIMNYVGEALRSDEFGLRYAATKLIARLPDPMAYILPLIRDATFDLERRRSFLSQLIDQAVGAPEKIVLLRRLLDSDLGDELKASCELLLARHGERAIFERLLATLATLPEEIATGTIMLFGHYPDLPLAIAGAEAADRHVKSGGNAARYAQAAVSGMLYVYDMDSLHGGSLRQIAPHAATPIWMEQLYRWSRLENLTTIQRLQILTSASNLGSSEATADLHALVVTLDPDDPAYDAEDEMGQITRSAFDEVRHRRVLLPLELGERLVLARRPNVPFAGAAMVAAHSNVEALDLLIRLRNGAQDWFDRDHLNNAIETLAARLGEVVEQRDCTLVRRSSNQR